VCVCVCVCVCVYIYIYTYMYMYECMYITHARQVGVGTLFDAVAPVDCSKKTAC